MTDFSKLSDAQLQALDSGDFSTLSDEDLSGLDSLSGDGLPTDTPVPVTPSKEPGKLQTALDYTGRALDYAGGLGRMALTHTPVALAADVIQSNMRKKPTINQPEDVGRALVGKAPRTAEYLERAGAPSGGSLSDLIPKAYGTPNDGSLKPNKGGMLDPTVRGTVGMMGDVASDPLSYLGKIAESLKPLTNPVGEGLEALGKKYYKSAWTRPDAAATDYAAQAGRQLPSDVGLKEGLWGSEKALEQGKNAVLAADTAAKKALFPQFKNQAVDPMAAWSPKLIQKIQELTKDPTTREAAIAAFEQMQQYAKEGPVSPETIWLWQRNLMSGVGERAFKNGRNLDRFAEVEKQMGRDFGDLLEREAHATSPELGAAFKQGNADMSALLRGQKAMRSGAKNEANRKGLSSQVGAALLAGGIGGASHSHGLSLLPAAGMYGMKALSSPAAKTGGGLLLNKLGKGLTAANADALLRRLLIK